jgi:hypothetical protein
LHESVTKVEQKPFVETRAANEVTWLTLRLDSMLMPTLTKALKEARELKKGFEVDGGDTVEERGEVELVLDLNRALRLTLMLGTSPPPSSQSPLRSVSGWAVGGPTFINQHLSSKSCSSCPGSNLITKMLYHLLDKLQAHGRDWRRTRPARADTELYQVESADQENDIAAVSARQSERGCGHNALTRCCHRRWILS